MFLVPVDPKMNNKRQLLSLLEFAGGKPERAEIRPLPEMTGPANADLEDRIFTATATTATKLKIAGAFELSADSLQDIGVWEMRYGIFDAYDATTLSPGALIRSAFWGSSLRMTLKASALHLEGGLTLGAVAASAQIGEARIEYELSLVGDLASSLRFFAEALDGLPVMGTFDYEAYSYFKARQRYLRQLFIELAPPRPSTVIAVDLTYPLEPSYIQQAQSMHYAMRCIEGGLDLNAALSHAPDYIESGTIKKTYADVEVSGEVTIQQQEKARRWLYA